MEAESLTELNVTEMTLGGSGSLPLQYALLVAASVNIVFVRAHACAAQYFFTNSI
eukprot:COSAG02_NODE_851_length_16536_cov_6.254000_3_plen_55_part_00